MPNQPSVWRNIIVNTDCYKNNHYAMYPEGTEYVSSYIESRGGIHPSTLFFGLQAFIQEYLTHPITIEDINEAEAVYKDLSIPFPRQLWLELINDHNDYLPIEIEAVPEGTVVPTHNVLVQIVNTDPKYPWLTNFVETALLRAVWYPTTVATNSWNVKQKLKAAFERTSDHPELVRIYLHDFGARGVSSFESATLGGMAHLVNFDMTDTVPAYLGARRWYNANPPSGAAVFQEHGVIIAGGKENEAESFRKLLRNTGAGVIGLLTDAWDHEHAVKNIVGKELHDEVVNYPGLVVIRCDSGDAVLNPVHTLEWLAEIFGTTTNSKGFKVLPDNLRVVQGDGLNPVTHVELYAEMERRGFAADNILCGMGAGLLQKVDRDTFNFSMKANAARINGEWKDVQKTPTGSAWKRSKPGRLALQVVDGEYRTVRRDDIAPEDNQLKPVFRDGKLLRMCDFSDVIARSEQPVPVHFHREQEPTPQLTNA